MISLLIKNQKFEFAIFASKHDCENISINFQLYYYLLHNILLTFLNFSHLSTYLLNSLSSNRMNIKSWTLHKELKSWENSWNDENVVFLSKMWADCYELTSKKSRDNLNKVSAHCEHVNIFAFYLLDRINHLLHHILHFCFYS